ncbi:Uncharacterised protein [Mycobacteroides abscessus subsp. abscessus]|nr:Uncharacterised protein [Mycobacteroides abscessus subsp. abscessus]
MAEQIERPIAHGQQRLSHTVGERTQTRRQLFGNSVLATRILHDMHREIRIGQPRAVERRSTARMREHHQRGMPIGFESSTPQPFALKFRRC